MKFYIFCVSAFILFSSAHGFKALVLVPMPAHSHFTLGFRIAEALANKGHEVTCVNPYPRKTPLKNYRDLPVTEIIAPVEEFKKTLFDLDKSNIIDSLKLTFDFGTAITKMAMETKNIQKLLNSKTEHFDVVIIENFYNDALVGIGLHFKAPVILISPMSTDFSNYIVGNAAPPSYVPHILGSLTNPMTFVERLENFFMTALTEVGRELWYLPPQRKIFKDNIKTDLELDDVVYNVSLILANAHLTIQGAVPTVPNIVEIGGYHIPPPKPLPKELQDYLDNAKEGVVLFSMGSNLKSKDLKPEVRAAILRAFGRLKQKVLWKFEVELPEAPPNVKVMSWLPQSDILNHPNVKAFISHGGLLSTTEAIHFGVPIIGVPVFGDQKNNINRAVAMGYGVKIPLSELTEAKLSEALDQVLNNPKYMENVKQRSKIMRDRPLSPIDTAMYWIEYVVRHGGAPHLRTYATKLTWCERNMIDIAVVLSLVAAAVFAIFYYIIKKILGLVCGKKCNKQQSKKVKTN